MVSRWSLLALLVSAVVLLSHFNSACADMNFVFDGLANTGSSGCCPGDNNGTNSSRMTSSIFTLSDGETIYYKDWGPSNGQVFTFSHGWPLDSDSWEAQMFHLSSLGYRTIAHDRRGHGRSSQPWEGNNMDQYADDFAELIEALDLNNMIMVGHSTGGGEVARYVGRHGSSRVAKAVLVGSVTPLMVQTPTNVNGTPIAVFDGFRSALLANRAQFFLDVPSGPFFGYNRPNATASQGVIMSWYNQGMLAGFKNVYDCVEAFSETDFSNDLRQMDFPTLVVHGDDDQVVPIAAAAYRAIELLPDSELVVVPGGAHGLPETYKSELNDLLANFAQSN